LAEPGSNSGSDKIFGIWRVNEEGKKSEASASSGEAESEGDGGGANDAKAGETKFVTVGNTPPKDLVYFEGRGHYSAPKFTWDKSSPPTGLLFLESDKLGSGYKNDMFIGSVDGRIFHFDLNDNRTELLLKGVLEDKIATDSTEYGDILFAEGFSIITDLKQGPDGYLYVVSGLKGSKAENPGAIYRIVPK